MAQKTTSEEELQHTNKNGINLKKFTENIMKFNVVLLLNIMKECVLIVPHLRFNF
jgi:hypothetical protein